MRAGRRPPHRADRSLPQPLAASTVETHKRTWTALSQTLGLPTGSSWCPYSWRKYSFPEKISENDKQSLRTQLSRIIDHVGKFTELGLSQAGREIYHNWYMNVESSVHAKRLDVYALRLMALLAVNDLKLRLMRRQLESHNLCDWQLEVRKLYDPIDADNKSQR